MDHSKRVPGSNLIPAYILFIVIAAAPLPSGSRDASTVAVWCIVLGAGLILASTSRLRRGHMALLAGIGFIGNGRFDLEMLDYQIELLPV